MFKEQPVTNPGTLANSSDELYEPYDLSHQVEMTLEEPNNHQVKMVEPAYELELGHQVEMTPSAKPDPAA